MALQFGRTQLSIPGPSIIPDRVLAAMHRPSPDIYEGELITQTESVYSDLKTVSQTRHHATIYITNGHGAWEAALCNMFSRGDKVLVLVTGLFGMGWADMARRLGIEVELLDFGTKHAADPNRLAERLRQDKNHEIKAVMTVQTDTASSSQNDIQALGQAIKDSHHPASFMVDCIASLACDRHEMDNWGVDVMVAGSQKGLMTPAGLGFVFFNDKAAEVQKSADLVSNYWDWVPRSEPKQFYELFGGTPPTHHLFALKEALSMLVHEEGITAAWARHERLARALWAALDVWGDGGDIAMNIADPAHRSHAVTTVLTGPNDALRLRQWCKNKAGLTLGIGIGLAEPGTVAWDSMFRIGHMGHLNVPMLMGLIGTIDAGLKALKIPHGSGACEAAAQVISEHDF